MANSQRPNSRWLNSRWMIGLCSLAISMVILVALTTQPLWLLTGLSPLICPNAIYAVKTDQPVIALTIDDGPDLNPTLTENTTATLLTLLDRYQAHATFFLISDKLTPPIGTTLAQAIVDHGHELGNHFTTDVRSIRPSPPQFAQGVQAAEKTLSSFAHPQWFRPAGGFCSASNAQLLQSQDYNYDIALGSIWPYDTHITSVPLAIRQILQNAQPGAILILHDSDKAGFEQPTDGGTTRGQRALQILAGVLPTLQAQGFQIVSLSELSTYGEPIRNSLALPGGLDTVRRRLISGMVLPSVLTLPSRSAWGAIALTSITASVLMLWLGFRHHFLRWQWLILPAAQSYPAAYAQIIAISFFLPALVEESIFRLLLLPTPEELTAGMTRGQWLECAVSLSLFVIAHPLINGPLCDRLGSNSSQGNPSEPLFQEAPFQSPSEIGPPDHEAPDHEALDHEALDHEASDRVWDQVWPREERAILRSNWSGAIAYGETFRHPTFLSLATVLGGACTLMYLQSGSIWPSVFFHWVSVIAWLLALGGHDQLHPPRDPPL